MCASVCVRMFVYLCMHVRVCGVLKMTDEGSNEMKEAQRTSVDGKKLLFNTHARTHAVSKQISLLTCLCWQTEPANTGIQIMSKMF